MNWYSCKFSFSIFARIPVESSEPSGKKKIIYVDGCYLVRQTSVRTAETNDEMRDLVKKECEKVPALIQGSLKFHNTHQVKGPLG